MLLQIGSFKVTSQGHHGVYFERTGHRVNLRTDVGKSCSTGGLCVDSYEERYHIYITGRGLLSRAQDVEAEILLQLCPESGKSYFRRREVDDANLEIYRVRSGKLEHADFRLQYTKCRTLSMEATLELEPLPESELSDVITNDWTVTP